MNLVSSFSPVMVEWLYSREVMRFLGFDANDLFFMVNENAPSIIDRSTGLVAKVDGTVVSLVLRAQDKEFLWSIGVTKMSKNELQSEYERLCEHWNSGELKDDIQNFRSSVQVKSIKRLIQTLEDKGFVLDIEGTSS